MLYLCTVSLIVLLSLPPLHRYCLQVFCLQVANLHLYRYIKFEMALVLPFFDVIELAEHSGGAISEGFPLVAEALGKDL